LVQPTTRKLTRGKIGTSWKLLCWSCTPIPPTSIDRKRKMWWCSILHEVLFSITVSLRNNGQHKIFKHIQIDHIYFLIFLFMHTPYICMYVRAFACVYLSEDVLPKRRYVGNLSQTKDNSCSSISTCSSTMIVRNSW
jgi:hypothetical protein